MYCSYRPVMMAVAIHKINASFDLVSEVEDYVLAVPGKSLAAETLQCGVESMRDTDKVRALDIRLCASEVVSTPGLADAIANVELVKEQVVRTGDHVLLIGRVAAFRVNTERGEPPLLSVGPDLRGFELLAHKGIHRLGVVTDW
jgi:flavin reductase (DIM6/NTAB) family NADH-FMN oxidoreductase RutF